MNNSPVHSSLHHYCPCSSHLIRIVNLVLIEKFRESPRIGKTNGNNNTISLIREYQGHTNLNKLYCLHPMVRHFAVVDAIILPLYPIPRLINTSLSRLSFLTFLMILYPNVTDWLDPMHYFRVQIILYQRLWPIYFMLRHKFTASRTFMTLLLRHLVGTWMQLGGHVHWQVIFQKL